MTEGAGQRRRLWLSPRCRGKVVVRIRHPVKVVEGCVSGGERVVSACCGKAGHGES